jgi:phytoene synthase
MQELTKRAADEHTRDPATLNECREVLKKHARSFRWASIFLSPKNRDDVAIVYAFCRIVDDAVDEAKDAATAAEALSSIKADLHRSRPENALVRAFVDVAQRYGIDLQIADLLISAVASDAKSVRIADEAELKRYAYGVAGTVGLIMCRLLDVTDERAFSHAIDLGIGMQLTNICRDVLEDATRDRVYLPESRLAEVGATQATLLAGTIEGYQIEQVIIRLLQEADAYYQSAELGMKYLDARPRLAIFIASRLYRAIGLRLIKIHNGNPLKGRAFVPWHQKMGLVCVAALSWSLSLMTSKETTSHKKELHLHLQGLPGTSAL